MNEALQRLLAETEQTTRPEEDDGPLTCEVKAILRGVLTPEQALDLREETGDDA